MSENSENSMNVYSQITFMKYFGQIVKKHRILVLFSGVLVGSILLAFSFINSFTSSTIFRFQVSNTTASSLTSAVQLESLIGKTETIREKSFSYLHSNPFYFELGRALTEHPEGNELIPVFLRSKKNLLLKFKSLFYETFTYEGQLDRSLQVAQALQKIIYFKKHSDNSIIMFTRAGTPELSLKIGQLLGPIVRKIILENESYDLQVSETHLQSLLRESNENLLRLNEELLQHQENNQRVESKLASTALMEMEKELRMAKIEVQRLTLLVSKLESDIKRNSVYSIANQDYKFVDQVSIERLSELKQQREMAIANAHSVEKSYMKLKGDNSDLPETEQIRMNLRWSYELEQSINKDLLIKTRDIESLQKLADNSVRVIGDTSIIPAKIKLSKPLRFVLGFLLGMITSLLGVYYFYDFFKVVKGQSDLRISGKNILNSLPKVDSKLCGTDLWKELPSNHHAMESFRLLMEMTLVQKSLCFVSSGKNEGKTFIIYNLAENLTRYGKKVLVVDTNFRNSQITKLLSGKEGIKVIPADIFKHDKHSLLDRNRLIHEIRIHSKDCDVILIDTQSLSESNDALIAASIANQVIAVASYLETFQHRFHEMIKKFGAADVQNYQLLLNKANSCDEIIKTQERGLDNIESQLVYLRKSS